MRARPHARTPWSSERGRGAWVSSSRIVVDDGGAYVSAQRLAAMLQGSWSAKGGEATLTVGKRSAHFVRNQARVVIAGQRCRPRRAGAHRRGRLARSRGVPRQGVCPARFRASACVRGPDPKSPSVKIVKAAIAFEELRYRSYPSFTRVVVETGANARLRGRDRAGGDSCAAAAAHASRASGREEIADGLVKEIRLEPLADGDAGATGGARRPGRRRSRHRRSRIRIASCWTSTGAVNPPGASTATRSWSRSG